MNFFLGNVLFQPLNPGGIYQGNIRKKYLPGMKGQKGHLRMINKMPARGFARRYGARLR